MFLMVSLKILKLLYWPVSNIDRSPLRAIFPTILTEKNVSSMSQPEALIKGWNSQKNIAPMIKEYQRITNIILRRKP